jgi:hypothetical protein
MNKFNRILLASGLAATASLIANSPAFAAPTTATVNLSGTVGATFTLTLTPDSNNNSLSLTPGSMYTDIPIATVASSTNNRNGLKIMVSSASGFKLVGTQASASIAYTLSEGAGNSPTNNVSSGAQLQITQSSEAGAAPSSNLFISYTVPANVLQGTYTDTITFTGIDK